ncbi:hypothetical protein SAMN02910400_02014 [Lachnospiraceae bacterium C10]|nr:hypothetical protein SAMN02910400_02014 [Lachnospiraceae bacterium C10]
MDYSRKADIINKLRTSMMTKEEKVIWEGNEDGRFIDERIAFEAYTPEEKAFLMEQQAKVDAKAKEIKKAKAEEEKLNLLFERARDERTKTGAKQWFSSKKK